MRAARSRSPSAPPTSAACARSRNSAGLLRVARAPRFSLAQERAGTGLAMKATLLVEILTEELPPKSLRVLSGAFFQSISKALATAHLAAEGKGRALATPRRLAEIGRASCRERG